MRIRIKAKQCLYEGVIVPTALYGAEACGIRSAESRKVNVLEMKCLRSFVRVSRMDRVRNEEVTRETEVRLDGWCEGGLGQQRNDDGACVRDLKEWRALVHM